MTHLQPKTSPQQRLAKTGTRVHLWPRPSTDWVSDLVKATTDQAVHSQGRAAMETVGNLAREREKQAQKFTEALNSCLGLIHRLERRETQSGAALDSLVERFDQLDQSIEQLSRKIESLRQAPPSDESGNQLNEKLIEGLVNGQGEFNRGLERGLDEIRELLSAHLDDQSRQRENAQPRHFDFQ